MNSDLVRRWGPWALIAAVLTPVAYVVVPKLNFIVWEGVNLVYGGLVLFALVSSLPLITLILRNVLWGARKVVIGAMAIETLETGLKAVWASITQLEQRIADAGAQLLALGQLNEEEKDLLGKEGMAENDAQLHDAERLQAELVEERDNQLDNYRILERNIKRFKLMHKRGLAYKALLNVLTAGTDGQNAQDMATAMESIQTQMNQAQARVNMILSRKRPVRRVEARVVTDLNSAEPEEEQPQAALPPARTSVNELPRTRVTPEGVVVRRPTRPN